MRVCQDFQFGKMGEQRPGVGAPRSTGADRGGAASQSGGSMTAPRPSNLSRCPARARRVRSRVMRIQFCGADRTVTGSCHLVEMNGLRIFLDAGLYQGHRDEARRINTVMPADVSRADAIILSHGHLDHCGKLPMFLRAGFRGPVCVTPASAAVARIVLLDAAEIQVEDARYLTRRARETGAPEVQPLYTPDDVGPVLQAFKRVRYGVRTDLGNGVSFTFHDAGHILGSAYVVLEWEESGKPRKLLFTADIGRYNTPILRDPAPLPGPVDFVITESTYGNTTHAPMDQVGDQFLDAVKFCIERRSRLIVPSFAVGRTQTVLWYMQKFVHEKLIPPVPIFVDSPMGTEVTKVHQQFRDDYDEQTSEMIGEKGLFGLARVTLASSTDQSKAINRHDGACVIVASSPTCEFGRVLHHLKQSIERPDDVVVFVGWTPPNTLGRRLQNGERRVRILDRWYELKCQVRTIHGLSAHADGGELLKFLAPTLVPQTTAYVVHGEVPQAEGFAERLLQAGIGNVVIPAMETSTVAFGGTGAPAKSGEPSRADME
jgi:metallo-beta-lactamase family protein